MAALLVSGYWIGRLTTPGKPYYDGAVTVYTGKWPHITNRSTASDVVGLFDNSPRIKKVVGVDPGPGSFPTREWVWSDGRSWTATIVWFAGPIGPSA